MAITNEEQSSILKVVAGLFNAAPGGSNLTELANTVSAGRSVEQLANDLAKHALFVDNVMAGKVTVASQVDVLMKNFGVVAGNSAGDQAKAFFESQINAKVGFGAIVWQAVNYLSGSVPPEFVEAANLLKNKALVSEIYSKSVSSSDLSVLQSVLSGLSGAKELTKAEAEVYLGEGGFTSGDSVTLTSNTDIVTANIFNAGLVFTPGGNDRVNALQDEDVLTGRGVNPTLNAVLGNANDNGAVIITPKLNNVETVKVAFTGSGAAANALDLQDATGVSTVDITRISQSVNSAEVGNVVAALKNMSIADTQANQAGVAEISFVAGALAGENSGELELDNVALNTINVGQNNAAGIGGRGVAGQGYENITIKSTGVANSVTNLNLPMDTGSAGSVTISGDKGLTIAGTQNITNAGLVEAVINNGGIAGNYGRLASVNASTLDGSLALNIPLNMLTTGKAETSGVNQDVTITGSKNADTFYLSDTIQAGDVVDGGDGTDTLVVYTGGITTGNVAKIENLDIQAVSNVTIDFDKTVDTKLVNIRNIDNTAGLSADNGDWTVTLNNLTATQASGLSIQHSTTTNNAIFDTTVQANLKDSTGASDTVGIEIKEGVNADKRFNFTLNTNADVVATATVERVENITITNSDTESNSVELAGYATHTGTVTLKGGKAGTFLNLDVDTTAAGVTGLQQRDVTGAELDGVAGLRVVDGQIERDKGWTNVGVAATQVRLVAGTIDASAEASDVTLRVSTTAANTNGGQKITMGAGNDVVIFDDVAGTSQTRIQAGLTNADTVAGGAGKNTLVIDGENTNVILQQSEWDNVSGFQTVYLAGNGAGNQYFLQIDNDMIVANGGGTNMITIDNDDDSMVNTTANEFFTGATNADRAATNTAARIDATTLSANTHFTYDGEEGAGATADRFVVNDQNTNGGNVIDGGDVNVSVGVDTAGVTRQLAGNQSADVLEVRNAATVTTADLTNVKNVGNIVINNDQAVAQTLNLTLNSATVDALSDAGHTASLTEIEALNIRANDGQMRDAAGSAITPTSASVLNINARDVSGAFALNITGDQTFAGNDTVSLSVNLGGAKQTVNLGGGTDVINLYAVAGQVAQATATGFKVVSSTGLASQDIDLTGIETINWLDATGAALARDAATGLLSAGAGGGGGGGGGGAGTAAVALSAAGTTTDGGATVNTTYSIASGTYTHTISGFGAGDKLSAFAGNAPSVVPDANDTDGSQSIQFANAATGATTTITLTGLTTVQDTGLFNVASFNTVFGAGTIA